MNKILISLAVLTWGSVLAAPSYISSDAKTKTATLVINAGMGTVNSGLNFNGAFKNSASITIPVGWKVIMQFKNVGMMPHSAGVYKGTTPPNNVAIKDVAFAGAYTPKLLEGYPMNGVATVKFVAKTAGVYNIVCGVPGHNLGGQYIGLNISSSAKVASYK